MTNLQDVRRSSEATSADCNSGGSQASKIMQNPLEIYVDDESKLTLHGLQQYYIKLGDPENYLMLNDLPIRVCVEGQVRIVCPYRASIKRMLLFPGGGTRIGELSHNKAARAPKAWLLALPRSCLQRLLTVVLRSDAAADACSEPKPGTNCRRRLTRTPMLRSRLTGRLSSYQRPPRSES